MSSFAFRLGCVVLVLGSVLAIAQRHGAWPIPPTHSDTMAPTLQTPSQSGHVPRTSPVQLQNEARELSELAQSVPVDVQHVNQGMFPKDTIEKLKRIEKLSKRLRGELAP